MQLILMPYKESSGGSKQMARRLGISRVLRETDFNPKEAVVCINWGRGDYPYWGHRPKKWINPPEAVMRSIDKLSSMEYFREGGVPTPPWTRTAKEAQRWIDEGHIVFARTQTCGMDGAGIIIVRKGDRLPHAALYTQYVEKETEYRVHVMNGECFYSNQKRPEKANGANMMVRTTSGGWYFRHMDELPPKAVQRACVAACRAVGLDFAGVDVGVDAKGNPCVYEVNTAPEMGPNTTEAYFRAFQKHYGQYKNNENVPIKDI